MDALVTAVNLTMEVLREVGITTPALFIDVTLTLSISDNTLFLLKLTMD